MATERVIIQVSETGTRRVQRNIEGVGRAASGAGNNVDILRRALAGVGGALVLRQAVRTLADFSQEMSTVRAITAATDSQFASLQKTARDLGATTRFSATQAAEGMVFLARAGFQTDQVLASIDDTLRLAQAGALDLGRAADIASNVLTGFRLEADKATRVVDVLAKAANSANTNVDQLGEGLKLVAPVAAGLGVSLEETVSAVAQLSNAGLQATVAGTGLRKVLATLEAPSGKAKTILKELGLTEDDIKVSSVGLTEALRRLNNAGLQAGDALEFFGLRGGPAAEVLLRITDRTDEFTKGLNEAEGFARRVAEVMDDNLNGALLAVRSAFEAVILSIGELGANSILTRTLRAIATGLRFVADNARVLQSILGTLALVTLPAVAAGINAIGVAIAANPLTVLGVAVAAATASLIAFSDQLVVSEDGVTTLQDVAVEAFDVILSGAKELAKGFVESIKGLSPTFEAFVGEGEITFKKVAQFAALSFDAIVGVASGAFFSIVTIFQELPTALKNLFLTAVNFIVEQINRLLLTFQRQVNTMLERVETVAGAFGKALNLGRVEIPLGRLEETTGTTFGNLGEIAAQEFEARFFESSSGTDLLERVFAGAESRAAARGAGAANDFVGPQLPETKPAGGGAAERNQTTQAVSAQAAAIAELNAQLQQERELAGLSEEDRQVALASLEIQNQLRKAGVDVENRFVQAQIAAAEAQLRDIQEIQKKQQVLDEIKGPEEERLERMRLLNELLTEGKINQEEFNRAVQNLGRSAASAGGFTDSLKNKFLAVDTSVQKLASSIGDLLLNSIDQASDALAEFAVDGFQDTEKLKEAFSSLLRDLAKGIIKLIIQTLILAAIRKALGAPAFGSPTSVDALPQNQIGGPVPAAQPTIVGENGPELFVPPTRGNIIPAGQVQDRQPVNLTVVNTQDPDEIPNFFTTAEGDEVFLNTFGRNARKIQSMLGIGV